MTAARLVLGIDPGLRSTGWGVIRVQGNALQHVASGLITTPSTEPSLARRLHILFEGLSAMLQSQSPHEAAVEEVFVNKNSGSSLKVGLDRGVCLLAPATYGRDVKAYTANHVKRAVVGYGHADKTQVALMVQRLLALPVAPVKDSADALAVAICHAHTA